MGVRRCQWTSHKAWRVLFVVRWATPRPRCRTMSQQITPIHPMKWWAWFFSHIHPFTFYNLQFCVSSSCDYFSYHLARVIQHSCSCLLGDIYSFLCPAYFSIIILTLSLLFFFECLQVQSAVHLEIGNTTGIIFQCLNIWHTAWASCHNSSLCSYLYDLIYLYFYRVESVLLILCILTQTYHITPYTWLLLTFCMVRYSIHLLCCWQSWIFTKSLSPFSL